MPAKSKSQQRLIALALKNPSKVRSENKGVLSMKENSLREFAETKTKDLPKHVKKKKSSNALRELAKVE